MLAQADLYPLGVILRAKGQLVRNHLGDIKKHLLVHIAAALGVLLLLVGGGLVFFLWLFKGLVSFEPFGPVLMDRLAGLVLFAFFVMLLFSNIVITLTTTYISEEIEFHMQRPLERRVIFSVKLLESMFYSSWAFLLLALPLFISLGVAKGAHWSYHLSWVLLTIPFITVPAALGALVTMLISALLPAKRSRLIGGTLVLGLVIAGAVIVRVLQMKPVSAGDEMQFAELLNFLDVGSSPLLPSLWTRNALLAASGGDWGEFTFWWLMLTTTGLMALQLCLWLVPPLFHRGWCLARESSASPHSGARALSLFPALDALVAWLPRPTRAFLAKDTRTFWRDPAQWSQLLMLFGMLALYIANIRHASAQSQAIGTFVDNFRNVIAFFNLGTVCFILSILSTRLVYPLLSLEGKQFWIVGLAPVRRTAVVWQKYWVCLVVSLAITLPLVLLSAHVLELGRTMLMTTLVVVAVMSFGLTSLSIGLGATLPNFSEDNPARIANGLGGTLNIILSLLYISAVTLLLFIPARLIDLGGLGASPLWSRFGWLIIIAILACNAAAIALPMMVGLGRWRRMDL